MEKIGLLYWCEGAGHAARNLAVASELEKRGVEVVMAGGGPGKKFVEVNGYEGADIEPVTSIETKTDPDTSLLGFAYNFVFREIPSYFKRFADVYNWLKEEEPDKLLTDDFLAVFAASIQGVEFSRVEHMTTGMCPKHVEYPLRLYDWITVNFGENVFLTTVWDVDDGREDVINVDPLAQKGDEEVEKYDILLIPGTMSSGFSEMRDELEEDGYDTKLVGGEEWELAPSMRPFTEAANCVICTGFSSIADTVVPGTPCVVYPFFSTQERIAEEIDQRNIGGIESVSSKEEAIEAAKDLCEGSSEPEFDNGAVEVAEKLLNGKK